MHGVLLLGVVVAPVAIVGTLVGRGYFSFSGRYLLSGKLRPGAPIVYRLAESSTQPDRDGGELHSAERGDLYYYLITKYWRVEKVLQDGWVVAITPLMEHIYLRRDDPGLRKANLLERLRYGARFPHLP